MRRRSRIARGFVFAIGCVASGLSLAASAEAAEEAGAGAREGCRIEPATNCAFAKLEGADLAGKDLSESMFHGAVLKGANLRGAVLVRIDLQVSSLAGADLREANLENAHLFAIDGQNAKLQKANLRGANLLDAKLQGADLTGADVTGARFLQANLSGATWIDGRRCADGSIGECK